MSPTFHGFSVTRATWIATAVDGDAAVGERGGPIRSQTRNSSFTPSPYHTMGGLWRRHQDAGENLYPR